MSFIHCSPLFHPLEPLPILGPAVARDVDKMHLPGSSKTSGQSAGTGVSSKKGKKVAVLRRSTNSPASTTLSPPTTAGSPYSVRQYAPLDTLSTGQSGHMPSHKSDYAMTQQPYQEAYFDSQDQGSLTFTTESQPMDDLSSSQQILDRDH